MQNFVKFPRRQFNTSLLRLSAFSLFLHNPSLMMIPGQSTIISISILPKKDFLQQLLFVKLLKILHLYVDFKGADRDC